MNWKTLAQLRICTSKIIFTSIINFSYFCNKNKSYDFVYIYARDSVLVLFLYTLSLVVSQSPSSLHRLACISRCSEEELPLPRSSYFFSFFFRLPICTVTHICTVPRISWAAIVGHRSRCAPNKSQRARMC